MDKQTTVNLGVLPQAFTGALQTDLSAQYDREEIDRWLSEGGTPPRNGSAVIPSHWSALGDAVGVFTRQMSMRGYYPENILVAIKSAVREAAVPLVAEQLVEGIVRDAGQSCITAYFEQEVDQRNAAAAAQSAVAVPQGVKMPGTNQPPALPEPRL